jgi:putative ABC transport system permease protein
LVTILLEETFPFKSFQNIFEFEPYGSSSQISPDSLIFINLKELETQAKSMDYNGINVVASNSKDVNTVKSELTSYFGGIVNVFTSSELVSTLSSVSSSLSDNFLAMGSVSLIVAFVDIMTTMFTTVYERRKEIGILKSIG